MESIREHAHNVGRPFFGIASKYLWYAIRKYQNALLHTTTSYCLSQNTLLVQSMQMKMNVAS